MIKQNLLSFFIFAGCIIFTEQHFVLDFAFLRTALDYFMFYRFNLVIFVLLAFEF